MSIVSVHEVYDVCVQVDDEYPRNMRVRPRSVYFDTPEEAAAAMTRALALLPHDITTVMVSRDRVERFDHAEDADLDDWPAARHIVTGRETADELFTTGGPMADETNDETTTASDSTTTTLPEPETVTSAQGEGDGGENSPAAEQEKDAGGE